MLELLPGDRVDSGGRLARRPRADGRLGRCALPTLLALVAMLATACLHAPAPTAPTAAPPPLPATATWTQVAMAQTAAWLDDRHLAVGRWDGALTVFRVPDATDAPLTLATLATTPAHHGIEMALPLSAHRLVTSNDDASLTDWRFDGERGLDVADVAPYDATYGSANAAALVTRGSRAWLVSGHANGWVLVWDAAARPLRLVRAIDVRSPDPVRPPWGAALRNVRGLVVTAAGDVVAGAEDGDLTVLGVPGGVVRARMRFSPEARLGINGLALAGEFLLVGNCAMGSSDRNLWLFRVDGATLERLGSTNLVADDTRPQVFTFDVEATATGDAPRFYASTQEGLVWGGTVDRTGIHVRWRQAVDPGLGAALTLRAGRLGVASYNVRVFALP